MKRKRMIKLLMSFGNSRNTAIAIANYCSGDVSHETLLHVLIPGDHPCVPSGMVSAHGQCF